jgi:predicted RND superfamily exporter protein
VESSTLERLGRLVVAHRRWVVVAFVALVGLCAVGASRIELALNGDDLLTGDDPDSRAYAAWRAHFPDDGNMLVVALHDRQGRSLLRADALAAFRRVERSVSALDVVDGAWSALTVPRPVTDAQGALTFAAVLPAEAALPSSEAGWQQLGEAVTADAELVRLVVSADADTLAIAVRRTKDSVNNAAVDAIEAAARREFEGAPVPEVELLLSGIPVVRRAYEGELVVDQLRFVAGGLVVLALLLWWLLRSVSAFVVPMLASLIGSACLLGAMGALGGSIDLLSNTLPFLVIVIGLSDSVHLLMRSDELEASGHQQSAAGALAAVGGACALNTLTTSAGFLSLVSAESLTVVRFAVWGTIGLAGALLADLLLTPALLSWRRSHRAPSTFPRALSSWAERVVDKRAPALLAAGGLIAALGIAGALRLDANTTLFEELPDHADVVRDTRLLDDELAGVLTASIVIQGPPGLFRSAQGLELLDRLTRAARTEADVGFAFSLADVVGRTWTALGRAGMPTTDDGVAQVLLLAESELTRWLTTADGTRAQVVVRVKDIDARRFAGLRARLEEAATDLGPGASAVVTGTTPVTFAALSRVVDALMSSLQWVLLAFWLILLGGLGSLRLALISIVPNALPLVVCAGFLGFIDQPVRLSTLIIFNISLALAVDHTVHLLVQARRAERAQRDGSATIEPWRAALRAAGPAVVVTGLLLIGGLSVLGLSVFGFIRDMGILGALIAASALFADLLLLPALLKVLPPARR